MTKLGSFTFVLHSHLPYVLSHGQWPHGMDWLNEAAAETYIPILNVFGRLLDEGIKPKVTVSITPVLAEQLADRTFKDGFKHYLEIKIAAAVKDEEQFKLYNNTHMASLALMWNNYYTGILTDFTERYKEDLVFAFRRLQDEGAIEIITSAATHGYLPLIGSDESINAQIKEGVAVYKRHFGKQPKGIWLPECAYRPRYKWNFPIENTGEAYVRKGIEEFLYDNNIKYFVVDHHLLEGGKAIGVYLDRFSGLRKLWAQFENESEQKDAGWKRHSPYNLYLVSSTGGEKPVAIFVRDPKTGVQVWSGKHGYPGDGNYLEFHKKHFQGGLRYWKITSAETDLGGKMEYDPDAVIGRVRENAGHFKDLVKGILNEHLKTEGKPGIVTAPYDAELFGHWWFEGPQWLYYVLKWLNADPEIELITAGEYIDKNPPKDVVSIPEGSWGEGGFHWIWYNDWTRWTWKNIYKAESIMKDVSAKYTKTADTDIKRMSKQLARELLLMESSDWQFLISTWSARDYAELRFNGHYNDFIRIYKMIQAKASGNNLSTGDWEFLGDCEKKDCLFSDVDVKWWQKEVA